MHTIIGVTMNLDQDGYIMEGVDYSYIRREYGKALYEAGAQPIFLDASIDPTVAASLCDGVVITGGADLDPALYDQEGLAGASVASRTRTDWERQLIDACDAAGVPILGICYGEQLLNVHYGGTLYQDIARDYGSTFNHGSLAAPVLHTITFEKDFLGYAKGQQVTVSARHHQAVHELAAGMSVVARAEDGTIEAVSGRGHYGIQWHAEVDASGETIYGHFVRLCSTRRRASAARRRAMRPRVLADFFALIAPHK